MDISEHPSDPLKDFKYSGELLRDPFAGYYSFNAREVGTFHLVATFEGIVAKARVVVLPRELVTNGSRIRRLAVAPGGATTYPTGTYIDKEIELEVEGIARFSDQQELNVTDEATLEATPVFDVDQIEWTYDGPSIAFSNVDSVDRMIAQTGNHDDFTEGRKEIRLTITQNIPPSDLGIVGGPKTAGKQIVVTRYYYFNIQTECSDGTRYDLFCIYLSAKNQSCDNLCSNLTTPRGYHSATGSNFADESWCNGGLSYLGIQEDFRGTFTPASPLGVGCSVYTNLNGNNYPWVTTGAAITGSAAQADSNRLCACDNPLP